MESPSHMVPNPSMHVKHASRDAVLSCDHIVQCAPLPRQHPWLSIWAWLSPCTYVIVIGITSTLICVLTALGINYCQLLVHDPLAVLRQRDVNMAAATLPTLRLSPTFSHTSMAGDTDNMEIPPRAASRKPERTMLSRSVPHLPMYPPTPVLPRRVALMGLFMVAPSRTPAVDALALKARGDLLFDAGRPKDALEAYMDALALDDPTVIAGAAWGAAAAHEAMGDFEAAVASYSVSLAARRDAMPLFERAQAYRELRRYADARLDYLAAADLYTRDYRDKRRADIARAQAAFCAFEGGDFAMAERELGALSRRLYSADVRIAHAAVLYRVGDLAAAEESFQGACEMLGAECNRYRDGDRAWLLGYRQWTPSLVDAIAAFVNLR